MVIEKNDSLGQHLKKVFSPIGLLPKKIADAGLFDSGYGILFTDQSRNWINYAAGQNIQKEGSLKSLSAFIREQIQAHPSLVCVFEDPSFDVHDKSVWDSQKNIFFVGERKLHFFDQSTSDSFSGIALDSESDTTLFGICSEISNAENYADVNRGLKPRKDISSIDDLIKTAVFIVTSVFDGECYAIWVSKASSFATDLEFGRVTKP